MAGYSHLHRLLQHSYDCHCYCWSVHAACAGRGGKAVIVFHIVAYGAFQFLFKELLPVHFLHLYAILFAIEVLMMLVIGQWWPRINGPCVQPKAAVDLTPWAYAQPCAFTLLSCVVALYVVFSPIGLVGDGSALFAPVLLGLAAINMLMWLWWHRRLNAGVGAQQ